MTKEPDNQKTKKPENQPRVRFAPSPTGFIHIGNLRTVLFGYLIAKKNSGAWILRIEDTDQKREVPGAIEKILETLSWVGIQPDEGVVAKKASERSSTSLGSRTSSFEEKGEFGPYIQSKRLATYEKYAQELLDQKKAYRCFCTSERLEKMRAEQQKKGLAPKYDGHCRNLSDEEVQAKIAAGEKSVIRLKVPENQTIRFEDRVYGKIEVDSETVDDQVLVKSDGFPTYHLAVVVDDHLMKISHVVRAEEWMPSTPKHVLLYDFFGWEPPIFVHVPNVVNESRKKLSKRRDSVSVEDFKNAGYLPEALINFLALLGWNPGDGQTQEIFSLNELVKKFDEKKIHRAGAVFDRKKLDWMNAEYIKQKTESELLALCQPYFLDYFSRLKSELKMEKPGDEFLKRIIRIEKERIKKLAEISENIDFYFSRPEPDQKFIRWKNSENQEMAGFLSDMIQGLEKLDEKIFENPENLKEKMFELAGEKRGEHLHPTRTALSGQKNSPGPFEIAFVIGKEETLERLKNARAVFE